MVGHPDGGTADDSGPVCPADIDGSSAVDFVDLVQILHWGGDGPEDLDGSGTVDFGTLAKFFQFWTLLNT